MVPYLPQMILPQEGQKMDWREESILWMVNAPFPKPESQETDYFVYATKTVTVDRGYYYRVWASHIVRKGDDPVEETYSYTDGIKVP